MILKRICQLSLLAHERSRFATCQWELLTPTDISIPLTHRLVLYTLEAGDCLFCVQECPRAGLQIKSARIPIFSDLTIEILTLTFPTQWQKRAVIHLIFYFITYTITFVQNVIKLFSIKFYNKNHLSLFSIMQHLVIFIQTRICKNIYPLYKTDQSLLLPPVTGKLSRPA